MSAPRDQQVESTETETSGTQETARLFNLGMKAALTIAFFSACVVILFALFSILSGQVGTCLGSTNEIATHPTPDGYELEITLLTRTERLNSYKVAVLKDGTPWSGFPKVVADGAVGTGPAGEYLSFTDQTSDDELTCGDFFSLEGLTSGSQYEVVLLWAWNDNKITSEVINVP